jgi:putative endonuclease
MGKHNELGRKGENMAIVFLQTAGYIVLQRNWRSGRAELDIIAMDNKTMVFIEVKTRSDDIFERPEDAVTPQKQSLITRAAMAYMRVSGHDWTIRFDIISVILRGGKPSQIDHIKDAFFPGLA